MLFASRFLCGAVVAVAWSGCTCPAQRSVPREPNPTQQSTHEAMSEDTSRGVSAIREVKGPVIVVSLMSSEDAQERSLGRSALRHGLLVGAVKDTQWLPRDEAAKLVASGQRYQLYGPTRLLGASKGSLSLQDSQEDSVAVRLSQRPAESEKAKVIAVAGATHAVLPRWPALVESNEQDRVAAREILVRHQVEAFQQLLVRTYVVDLDGDGANGCDQALLVDWDWRICDDSMKFRSLSRRCETCPAKGEPARAW